MISGLYTNFKKVHLKFKTDEISVFFSFFDEISIVIQSSEGKIIMYLFYRCFYSFMFLASTDEHFLVFVFCYACQRTFTPTVFSIQGILHMSEENVKLK